MASTPITRQDRLRGIPTHYAGTLFRSRLEAAFAAWFDGLKIRWAYEPTDLEYYIPDFDLLFKNKPLLLEIKPSHHSMAAAKSKIESTSWEGDIAILVDGESRFIGEIFEADIGWDRAVLTFCLACKQPTIVSEGGRWSCRHCGSDGRQLWWAYDAAGEWRRAKALVQWRPAAE